MIPVFGWGTAVPIAGYYAVGSIIFNSSPTLGGVFGWVCITAGTPGTWAVISPTQGSVGTQATIGAIAVGTNFVLLTSNAAGSYTLPKGNSQAAGFIIRAEVSTANATTFAAASGDQVIGVAAVTTANSPMAFLYDGTTTWYRI